MFWVLILIFMEICKTFKKLNGGNLEIFAQFNKSSKGNIAFSLFYSTNMDISCRKTLELR